MTEFKCRGWTLFEAIDGLMAYDGGATDSGIKDEDLREAVIEYLRSLNEKDFRLVCADFCRHWLTGKAISQGYGMSNILDFGEWLADNGIDAR